MNNQNSKKAEGAEANRVADTVCHLIPIENVDGSLTYMLISIADDGSICTNYVAGAGPLISNDAIFVEKETNVTNLINLITAPPNTKTSPEMAKSDKTEKEDSSCEPKLQLKVQYLEAIKTPQQSNMSGSPSKRVALAPMDIWSIQEQLSLASAVIKSGENWAYVSRTIKSHFEKTRPLEWFSPKNCARQYSALLDKVEKPKRKRGSTESTVQSIVRILKDERIKELKFLITQGQDQYTQMNTEVVEIENGKFDNNLSELSDDIKSDSDIESDVSESSASTRLSEMKEISGDDKSSNLVDKKLLSEQPELQDPINVSNICTPVSDNNLDTSIGEKPVENVPSTPKKSASGSPNVSPQLKNLVHTAIAGASAEDDRPKTMSPTNAPTLSMLLEMPPRDRGQPLPEIPSLMSPNKSPTGEKILDITSVPEIKLVNVGEFIMPLKSVKHNNDVDVKDILVSELVSDCDRKTSQQVIKVADGPPDTMFPDSVPTEINNEVKTSNVKEVDDSEESSDENASKQALGSELADGTLKVEPSEIEIKVDDISKEKGSDELKLPLSECSENNYQKDDEATKEKESSPIVEGIDIKSSSSELIQKPSLAEAPSESTTSEKVSLEIDQNDDAKDKIDADHKETVQSNEKEDTHTDIDNSNDIIIRSSPKKAATLFEATIEESITSSTAEVSKTVPKIENTTEACTSIAKSNKEDEDGPSTETKTSKDSETKLEELKISSPKSIIPCDDVDESTPAVNSLPEAKFDAVPEKVHDSSAVTPSENPQTPSKSATNVDAKPSTEDQDQDAASVEKAKNHYIGRGKKAFVVTIVENERGEKVELKTADGSSIKVTRNLSKETGLKIEDLPYSKKSATAVKEKDESTSNVATPTKRRGHVRTGNAGDMSSKESSKTPTTVPPSRQSSSKKGSGKNQNSDVKTPHLRSRRGPTSSPTPMKEDSEKEKQLPVSDLDEVMQSVAEGDSDKNMEINSSEDKKESPIPQTKPTEEPILTKLSKEKEKEKEKTESNDTEDEFSDALSELDNINKKENSETEDEADESDSSRNVSSKKISKSRKERLESADMADDDSSNSANDSATKKRITRRSAKASPRKSDSKIKTNEEKSAFRHRDRLSLPVKDSKSESKAGRSSKALTRVKHLSEEASLIYGDLETQTGDGFATRMTRARAKTSSSTPTFTSASKNVTPSSEPETSSDTEHKARSTRSRTAAAVATTSTTNSVIDQLPPVTIDSNPSSPCSSTTNSTIIDEDKDQRAFRKSIMLVWNRIAAHKFSSLFLKPISEDKAPGYLEKVKRPMDLATIKRNVETGQIRTYRAFERDVFLMFMNAFMFNPIEHEVSKMSKEMECDVRTILEDHQKMFPESVDGQTPIQEKFMRQNARILFPALESTRLSDSEPEMEEIGEKKISTSNSNRKRRETESELEATQDMKKRKTRTSAANSNTSNRKIKPQVSPDIVSASYDM